MKYDKQAALVAQLYRATVDEKVAWADTTRDDNFEAAFPRQSVVISRDNDDDYSIAVINKDGIVADEFSDRDLRDVPNPPIGSSWYQTMKELWQLARRHALGADEAMDDILGLLGNGDE